MGGQHPPGHSPPPVGKLRAVPLSAIIRRGRVATAHAAVTDESGHSLARMNETGPSVATVTLDRLRRAVADGRPIAPHHGDERQLTVSARDLRTVLFDPNLVWHPAGLNLVNVRFAATVDLSALRQATTIAFTGCEFANGANFSHASMSGDLKFKHCTLRPAHDAAFCLFADHMLVGGDFSLEDSDGNADVLLQSTTIQGNLLCDRLHLWQDEELFALHAERLTVHGGAYFIASAMSNLSLHGAHLDGPLDCSCLTITNSRPESDFALNCELASFGGSVYLNRDFNSSGPITFVGASIRGQLNMADANFARSSEHSSESFALDHSQIDGSIMIHRTRLGLTLRAVYTRFIGLEVSGSTIDAATDQPALALEHAVVASDVLLDEQTRITGFVTMRNASVGGSVTIADTIVLRDEWIISVDLSHIRIGGDFLVTNLVADYSRFNLSAGVVGGDIRISKSWILLFRGERLTVRGNMDIGGVLEVLHIRAAQIDGDLQLSGLLNVQYQATPGAVILNRVRIGGSFFVQRPFASGAPVYAQGITVSGNVQMVGASLMGVDERGVALRMDEATVGGTVRFNDASVGGTVGLSGASIHGDVNVHGIKSTTQSLVAFENSRITGALTFTGDWIVVEDPILSLTDCHAYEFLIGQHFRTFGGRPVAASWRIDGAQYTHLRGGPVKLGARLRWLGSQPRKEWSVQPYVHAARISARSGDTRASRVIGFRSELKQIRRAPQRSLVKALYGLTVGFGYYPILAGGWLATLVLVLGYVVASHRGYMLPLNVTHVQPHLHAFIYAADNVLPVIGLGQASAFTVSDSAPMWFRLSVPVAKVLGWIFTSLFIAGVTGLLRRDSTTG